MIAMGKRSGCEVGARALARVNRGRNWKDGMEAAGKAEEIWRRVTGITVEMEGKMDERERKCAARRLVKWVEAYLLKNRGSSLESGGGSLGERGDECADGAMLVPHPSPAVRFAHARPLPGLGRGDEGNCFSERSVRGGVSLSTEQERLCSVAPEQQGDVRGGVACEMRDSQAEVARLVAPLTPGSLRSPRPSPSGGEGTAADVSMRANCAAAEGWACAQSNGGDLERVCGRLGISVLRFTRITKEFLNVSGRELTDGIRLRGVREALRSRVVSAAKELWGEAGTLTYLRVMDGTLSVTKPAGIWCVWGTEKLVREEVYEQRKRRVEELFARVEAVWRSGEFDRDAFALELGFASFAIFRRACLNVDGESPRQKAWRLCCDVVEYFLAAEAKVLREMAMEELETPRTIRARWLYSGGVEKCAAGADYWDAMEFGNRALMEEMRVAVGPPG